MGAERVVAWRINRSAMRRRSDRAIVATNRKTKTTTNAKLLLQL